MKVKTQTGIVCIDDRSTSAHLAVISLAAREASHYDYAGLRPTSIQPGWLREGHDWELGVVLLGYKHRKTGPGTLNVFEGSWAGDHLDELPVVWQRLIAHHTPGKPVPKASHAISLATGPQRGPRECSYCSMTRQQSVPGCCPVIMSNDEIGPI